MSYSPSQNKEFIFIQDESDKQIEIPIDKFQKFFMLRIVLQRINHKAQLLIMVIPYTSMTNLIVD